MSTQTLDIVIGLAMVFLVVSLIASALNELLAAALDLRAATLENAVTSIAGSLAQKILEHPLVQTSPSSKSPSYIEPTTFANALIDEVTSSIPTSATPAIGQVRTELEKLDDPDLKKALLALLDSSHDSYETFIANVAKWFDGNMDRISGCYKRRAQFYAALFAVVVVMILNVDAIKIFDQLSAQPAYASAFAQRADSFLKSEQGGGTTAVGLPQTIASLNTYVGALPAPVGWHNGDLNNIWLKISGLLMTAIAGSLGAPFWFDALSKVANLRATGPKP